jgi:adenosylcobinamide-phosphate synthase
MTLAAPRRRATALGLALGFALDQALGDPRRLHPVAGFGALAARLEERSYADHRAAGVLHVGLLAGSSAGLGTALAAVTRGRPRLRLAAVAVATWTVLGGRSLQREAQTLGRQLGDGDLAAARHQIRNLVGRDPSALDAAGLARACVESVAENTSDAVVAPLFWGAVAGLPGLLAYRAVNTLDAMVGHRSPRYHRFGWAAARLDDAANWLPARVCGLLTVLVAPAVGGRPADTWRAWQEDAARHPSPNAGVVEAAFAGALGVRLGGTNVYDGVIEDRGTLGGTRPVAVADIRRAARLSLLVSTAAAGVAVAFALRSRTSIVTRAPFRGVSPRWADRGTEFQRRRR